MSPDRSEVIADIKLTAGGDGQLTSTDYDSEGKYSVYQVKKHFDTWNDAIQAAGMVPNRGVDPTVEDIVRDMRSVASGSDSITTAVYNSEGKYNDYYVRKLFGSWEGGLDAAGLEVNVYRDPTRKELVDDMLDVRGPDRTLPRSEFRSKGKHCFTSIVDEFGSWNEGLEAAGIPVGHRIDIPEEEVINDIVRLYEEHDGITKESYESVGEFSHTAICERFGSWNGALKSVGLDTNKPHDIPKRDLLDDIERVYESNGRLTMDLYREQGEYSLTPVLSNFKTWLEAVSESSVPTSLTRTYRPKTLRKYVYRHTVPTFRESKSELGSTSCEMCGGKSETSHWHHVLPAIADGSNEKELLIPLCGSCHRKTEHFTKSQIVPEYTAMPSLIEAEMGEVVGGDT